MSHEPALGEADLAFERMLLGAGRAEALPHERTEAALRSFTAGLAALQAGAGASVLQGPMTSSNRSAWLRLAAAAKWLLLGAVLGAAAAIAWRQPPAVLSAANEHNAPVVSRAVVPTTTSETAPTAKSIESSPAEPPTSERKPQGRNANGPASPGAKPSSDLAAEVAALDGIRTAIAIGALHGAEQLLADYRRQFARGALRSEAEVLALEVLLAQGQKSAAIRAGERFIVQHPRDPQVTRVRSLIQ